MSDSSSKGPSGGYRSASQVDRVLARAAEEPTFLRDLQARGTAAAVDAGFVLSDSEKAVLDAASSEQLAAMASHLPKGHVIRAVPLDPSELAGHPPVSAGSRPFVPLAAVATGAVLLGGAAASSLLVFGSRPDESLVVEPSVPLDVVDAGGRACPDAGTDAEMDADTCGDGGDK